MMRDENQRLNASEYEQGATVLQSRPQFLVIELTQGCNLACPMCRAAAISTTQSRMERSHFEFALSATFRFTAQLCWIASFIIMHF